VQHILIRISRVCRKPFNIIYDCISSLLIYFQIYRYYLALVSAGIIGLSHCDVANTFDKLTESVSRNFDNQNIQANLHGYSAAMATVALNIIRTFFLTQVDILLTSFSEIPIFQRRSIIRLLLCSSSCSNLLQSNQTTFQLSVFLQDLLTVLMSSIHQCDVLLSIVDFIQQDCLMLSNSVSLLWFHPFFKNNFFARDERMSLEVLLEASVRTLSCIRKYIGIAKNKTEVYLFKLPSFFSVELFILRLMSPIEIASHPLAQDCTEHFRFIFEVAAFPQDVILTNDTFNHLKLNVLSPRSVDLVLKRPLCAKEDIVCVELSLLVQEAILRLPGFSHAIFSSLLRNSASLLSLKKKLHASSSSNIGNYHGILNLGCTCYFNSITQQLFMLPAFAASVIAARMKIEDPVCLESSEQLTENGDSAKAAPAKSNARACGVLEKFQELMISLRHGSESVVYPKFFCDYFQFPDGSCILPDVQQDALEYFHILCDHLDNALKGGQDEKLLSRFFGGRSATQLICKGCPHRYERFEHFFTLQLAVFSNRSNSVLGALQDFVAGELLEGDNQYFCSQCNKKVDTVKRTVLADLPDSIIVGLKRFDFNYDTMQRIKLNVEVPFSYDLDMSPFCRENLGETPEDSEPATKREPGYYEYSLAGIVVHSGMADSGHYFSIIRDPEQAGLWHKFNDDLVTPIQNFDPKQFFGGHSSGKSVHTNAYILVYNRKIPIFNHQYGQVSSIESTVQMVQETGKFSTHTMFVDTLRNKPLWQCLTLSMHQLFSFSDDDRMETAYIDLILKLNLCSALDSLESVESFLLPLHGSLRSARKCDAILEHCFAKFDDTPTLHAELFQSIVDSGSKRPITLPPLFTRLIDMATSTVNECDFSMCTAEEGLVYRNIVFNILKFYGNLSYSLFALFPQDNPDDFEPQVASLGLAVQCCLYQALQQGLGLIFVRYFDSEQNDANDQLCLFRTCLTAANFSHLSEENPKIRSKRRAYLRSFVYDCRHFACWNCLKLLKICFLDQQFVSAQNVLAHGSWSQLVTTLFSSEFLVRYLNFNFSDHAPLLSSILLMFQEVIKTMLPLVSHFPIRLFSFSIIFL
jgi:ubiquitin C-terminal hydrolase